MKFLKILYKIKKEDQKPDLSWNNNYKNPIQYGVLKSQKLSHSQAVLGEFKRDW